MGNVPGPRSWSTSRATPAAGIFAFAFAAIWIGGSSLDGRFAAAAAAVAVATLLLVGRLPPAGFLLVPVSCDLVIALLREGLGGSTAGIAPLVVLPVVWVGLTLGWRSVLTIAACTGLLFGLPIAIVGAPQYPASGWRGVVVWSVVAFVVGLGANRITAAQHLLTETAEARATALAELVATQSAIAGSDPDIAAVMHTVVHEARRLTGADAAVVELADGPDLVYSAASGDAASHVGLRVATSSSISGLALRAGETLVCDDSETDDRVDRESCRRVGARSIIVVPLRHDAEHAGVLKVYSAAVAAFAPEHANILSLLASMIGTAMTRAEFVAKMRAEAVTDELTGLPNRRAWYSNLERAMERSRRSGVPLTVALVDLDGFKEVNDRHGHSAGDAVLREIGRSWPTALRETDFLGRIGGDEFGVVLEGASVEAAEEIIARLEQSLEGGPKISVGVVEWNGVEDVAAVVARADAGMYARKLRRRTPALG